MATQALIATAFGFDSTAAEVLRGVDLTGKRAIVTGGSSGLGVETARALASAGAEVTLAVRDTAAGERVAAKDSAGTKKAPLRVAKLDLAIPASVAALVRAWDGPLHLLVNNAAVMALPMRTLTPQGWEIQLATNHLGHFALAIGLHDALAAAGDARIVSLTSRSHLRTPVDFEDLHFESRPYAPFTAYAQSKTANVLFAVEATRRWARDGIIANAAFPGVVPETNLVRHVDPDVVQARMKAGGVVAKTIAQGAATSVLVATSPQLEGIGGRYFEDCNEAATVRDVEPDTPSGVAGHAVDPTTAERLWELSERLLA